MLNARFELVVALVFMAAIVIGLYLTSRIDLAFSSDLETFSGPRAYPGLILGLMLVFNLLVVARQVVRFIAGHRAAGGVRPLFYRRSTVRAIIVYAALVAFLFAFEPVGFILTMIPLLFVAALMNGAPDRVNAAVVAVIMTFACLAVFRYGLNTVMPEGILGIDMIF